MLFDNSNYKALVSAPSTLHYERQIQELKEENQKLLGALRIETSVRQQSPNHIRVEDDFVCLSRGSAENLLCH